LKLLPRDSRKVKWCAAFFSWSLVKQLMKQPENNEIDSLLRGLASRESSVTGASAESAAGVHLDADELSSYAEGALPVATRARYTSHLADCDECREIVTHLSLAAGPALTDTPVAAAAARFDWRKMLAGLFAPAMLRYAMPAIVLIVGGFAFFMWQQQRKESLVAVNTSSQPEAARVAQSGTDANKELTAQRQLDEVQTRAGAPSAPQATSGAAKSGDSDEKAQKTADAAKPNSTPTGRENEAAKTKNEDATAEAGSYASEPAPPPAVAKPVSAADSKDSSRVAGALAEMKPASPRKKESDKQTEKQVDGADTNEAPADESAAGKDDDRKKAKAVNGARSSVARRDQGRDEEESETRSVGGRRFQRHNNVWVDTAFNSSLSAITLRRGSETYRALVADEPGIDTIAKQLSGEVIVVWKGRAYRIL
jgi:hypothetical protein